MLLLIPMSALELTSNLKMINAMEIIKNKLNTQFSIKG